MSETSFESSASSLSQTNIDGKSSHQLDLSESRDQRSKSRDQRSESRDQRSKSSVQRSESIKNEEEEKEEDEIKQKEEQDQDKEEEDYDGGKQTTTKKKNTTMPDMGQPMQTSTGSRKRNLIIACVGVTTVVAIIIAVIVFMNTGNTDENNIEKSALKITAKTSEATTLKSMTTHPTSITTLKKRNTTQTTAQTIDNIITKILKQYSTILPTTCSEVMVCDDTAMDETKKKILNVRNCATVHNLIKITKIAVSPHPIKIAEVFRMSVEADILTKIDSPVKANVTGTVTIQIPFMGPQQYSQSRDIEDLCPLVSNTCNTDNGNSAAHCPTCPLDVGVFTTQLKVDLTKMSSLPDIVRVFQGNIDLKIEVTNAGRSGCFEFTLSIKEPDTR